MKNKNLKKAIKRLEKLKQDLIRMDDINQMDLFGIKKEKNLIPENRLDEIITELKKYNDEV